MRIYQEAGGHIDRLLMSHMDSKSRLIHSKDLMLCVLAAVYTRHYVKNITLSTKESRYTLRGVLKKYAEKYCHFFILCSNVIMF